SLEPYIRQVAADTVTEDRRQYPGVLNRGARLFLAALSLAAGTYGAIALLAQGSPPNVVLIASLLTFAGGLLSTSSPCGYSSLSLLRPQGHYGVQSVARWSLTLFTHALGYALGVAVLGGGLGLLAWLLPFDGLGGWPLALVGLAAVGYGLQR